MKTLVNVYYDGDADLSAIRGETIAVIGYGSQGRAQALNMRDSGLNVIIGVREGGPSWEKARSDGLSVYTIQEAAKMGTIIHMLIPDPAQPGTYKSSIEANLSPGKTLVFSHSFNIHFKQIIPPEYVDVILIAPKGPGPLVRDTFVSGTGTPCLIAIHQNYSGKAKAKALAIAKAVGCTRIGAIETTFKEEAESDLIGEQIVLVGGLMELIKKGFEVLVEAGYTPENAYFEACHEAKLIMDMIYRSGITGMLHAVSDTAKYGGLTVGPKIIDEGVKARMRDAIKRVQSGEFAKEWVEEYAKGAQNLKVLMEKVKSHQIEEVGKRLRKLARIEK